MEWVELVTAAGILIAAVASLISAVRASKASQDAQETKQIVGAMQQQLQAQTVYNVNVGQLHLGPEGESKGEGESQPRPLKLGDSPPSPEAEPPHADQVEASQ